jgi:hypothetical protein
MYDSGMTQKLPGIPKAGSKSRASGKVDDFDIATSVGHEGDGELTGEGVIVSVNPAGSPYLVPVRLRNADPEQRAHMLRLQNLVADHLAVMEAIAAEVGQARRANMSWGSIGWCIGLTEAGARMRFGGPRAR